MERRDSLVQIVSELMEIDSARITSDLPLAGRGMQGSLARTRLDAAIRKRIGIRCPAVYTAKVFGELETAIFSDSTSRELPAAVTPSRVNAEQLDVSSTPISCGIDIENVEDLPAAKDYREDEFYKLSFTATEIAYCLLQENPRMHFAARWCAKEALKKCDAGYLHSEMSAIELVTSDGRAPYLALLRDGVVTRLPVGVSISHTSHTAVAVVIRESARLSQPLPAERSEVPADQLVASRDHRGRTSRVGVLAFFALALSLWALLRTLL
jgi:phosphopantetheine--protein transferase-like protein